jgi:hypothetical protein
VGARDPTVSAYKLSVDSSVVVVDQVVRQVQTQDGGGGYQSSSSSPPATTDDSEPEEEQQQQQKPTSAKRKLPFDNHDASESPPRRRKPRFEFSQVDEALLAKHLAGYPPEDRGKSYVFKEFKAKVRSVPPLSSLSAPTLNVDVVLQYSDTIKQLSVNP